MKKFLIALFIFPTLLFSQTAKFRADSTHLWQYCGGSRANYDRALEMEWRIHGQSLHFGSKPIEIIPDSNRIDTLFYKQYSKAKWDRFICIIKKPLSYRFVYNECCDAFYIAADPGKFLFGTIIFGVTQTTGNKTYLGTLDETGILVDSPLSDTLKPNCRSVMSPNVYLVTFSEIKICKDTTNCREGTCLFVEDGADVNDVGFKTISCKTSFLYMPLSNDPLLIIYDPKTGKIVMK